MTDAASNAVGRPDPDEPRPLRRNPYVWAAVAAMITIPALRPFLRHVPEPPPVLGQVPDYQLTDQQGRAYGSADLRGRVYIAHTFFSHCPTVCPPMLEAMHDLQERIEQEEAARREALPIRLVSITVDPVNDTPERLREVGAEYGADLDRWRFLTGPEDDLRDLVVNGLMTEMGEPEVDEANVMTITHAARLVLVDDRGGIRGYYGADEMGVDEVFHRAQHVVREMDR